MEYNSTRVLRKEKKRQIFPKEYSTLIKEFYL